MDAATAGLIGAAIGVLGSALPVIIQSYLQSRREKTRAILEYAMAHRREAFEFSDKVQGQKLVEPLAVHVHYQLKLIELVESGKLTEKTLAELHKENEELGEAVRQAKQNRVVSRVIASHEAKKNDSQA